MGRGWNKGPNIAALHAIYKHIIEENADDYLQAEKKTTVSQRFARTLEAEGIRFVRWRKFPMGRCTSQKCLKEISTTCRESKHANISNQNPPGKLRKPMRKRLLMVPLMR